MRFTTEWRCAIGGVHEKTTSALVDGQGLCGSSGLAAFEDFTLSGYEGKSTLWYHPPSSCGCPDFVPYVLWNPACKQRQYLFSLLALLWVPLYRPCKMN